MQRCAARALSGILACALWAVAAPCASAAEIAVVRSGDAEPYRLAAGVLRDRLGEAGHTVREHLAEDVESGTASTSEADVMVAIGSRSSELLAEQRGPEPSLVYCMVTRSHLVSGEQVHGVSAEPSPAAQLAPLRRALPDLERVGFLYSSSSDPSMARMRAWRTAAEQVDDGELRVLAVDVDAHDSFAGAVAELLDRNPDVIVTAPDPQVYRAASVRALLLASLRRRVPVLGFSRAFVRAGALLGLDVDPRQQGLQATRLVKDLLAEQTLPDLIEPETTLLVNRTVARRLRIELPASLLARAEQP